MERYYIGEKIYIKSKYGNYYGKIAIIPKPCKGEQVYLVTPIHHTYVTTCLESEIIGSCDNMVFEE